MDKLPSHDDKVTTMDGWHKMWRACELCYNGLKGFSTPNWPWRHKGPVKAARATSDGPIVKLRLMTEWRHLGCLTLSLTSRFKACLADCARLTGHILPGGRCVFFSASQHSPNSWGQTSSAPENRRPMTSQVTDRPTVVVQSLFFSVSKNHPKVLTKTPMLELQIAVECSQWIVNMTAWPIGHHRLTMIHALWSISQFSQSSLHRRLLHSGDDNGRSTDWPFISLCHPVSVITWHLILRQKCISSLFTHPPLHTSFLAKGPIISIFSGYLPENDGDTTKQLIALARALVSSLQQ